MRIICGGPIRQHPKILEAHLKTLREQKLPAGTTLDYFFIDDCEREGSRAILSKFKDEQENVVIGEPPSQHPGESIYEAREDTTHWTGEAAERMGAMRQRFLDYAAEQGYDAAFMVDSDLLLSEDTLSSMMSLQKPITSAVFWTRWKPNEPRLPNVWLTGSYGLSGRGMEQHEFLQRLANKEAVRVYGLGACTLFNVKTVTKKQIRYYPAPPNFPWEIGEDRLFCKLAEQRHVEMWADGWPSIFHAYRPSDVEEVDAALEEIRAINKKTADFGDYISAVIEPMQEPNLGDYQHFLRGRIGQLRLVPGLEEWLLSAEVGEDSMLQVEFPAWFPVPQYRGKQRTLRVKLLGVKSE